MNRYMKLVNFELNRFGKIYFSLFIITFLMQFAGLYLFAHNDMKQAKEIMRAQSLSSFEYVNRYGLTSFSKYCNSDLWFLIPIALCAASLILYVFIIWYREWFGKNTFVYRLLMLPTARRNVFMAKTSIMMILVLGLIAMQLLILPLQNILFHALVPSEFRDAVSITDIVRNHQILQILIPRSFIEFVLYYGAGLAGVIVVFTAILIERSYHLKGIIGAVVYCAASVALFFSPVAIAEIWLENYLYPMELLLIEAVVGLLIGCGSLWISSYLLNKKITV